LKGLGEMSIHDGRLADGITMRPCEDQNQIVSSMERLTLVDDLSHGLGNTADENQRLDRSRLVRDKNEAGEIHVSTELDSQEKPERSQLKQHQQVDGQRRIRKPTEKGISFRISLLDERRKSLTRKLLRQSGEINELLLSDNNYTTVKEQMVLFNDVFQMLVEVYQEVNDLSEDQTDWNWFEEIDEKVFIFKHRVNNWLQEAAEVRSKSSGSRSRYLIVHLRYT